MKVNQNRYKFSFTSSSLKVKELVLLADAEINGWEVNITEILGGGKSATAIRHFRELNKRLGNLTDKQKKLLVEGDFNTQKQISFLAVCKTYHYVRDFVVEVLREKILVFDFHITDGNYVSFFRRKSDEHDEINGLTDKTQDKIKQVIFRMLEQADFIDSVKNKILQPQFISSQASKVVYEDDPNLLKIFFKSDLEIKNMKNE